MTGLFHLRSRNWLWLGVNTLFLEQLYNPAERPDYRQPVLFALLVAVLLFVRIPFVRRRLIYSTRS